MMKVSGDSDQAYFCENSDVSDVLMFPNVELQGAVVVLCIMSINPKTNSSLATLELPLSYNKHKLSFYY